ncbi:hypothetical protein VPHK251G3_0073 [Vibrio phage K251 g3]
MNVSKVYARKTMDGYTVLACNFEDLSKAQVNNVVDCAKLLRPVLDSLSANSPYREDTFIPELNCTIAQLRETKLENSND